MSLISYQPANRTPYSGSVQASLPSRALLEAAAAHFDGRLQNVPYGARWDGASLEANEHLHRSGLSAQHPQRKL